MSEELKKKFKARLVEAANKSSDLGYHPSRFFEMLEKYGDACVVAEKLVSTSTIQVGLKRAVKKGLLDLAIESIMLEDEFKTLFKKDVLEWAALRLQEAQK